MGNISSYKLEEKEGNLKAQKKQVKIELQELEVALRERARLLDRIDGALEFIGSIGKEQEVESAQSKKEK